MKNSDRNFIAALISVMGSFGAAPLVGMNMLFLTTVGLFGLSVWFFVIGLCVGLASAGRWWWLMLSAPSPGIFMALLVTIHWGLEFQGLREFFAALLLLLGAAILGAFTGGPLRKLET